jgi:hypothetical protein
MGQVQAETMVVTLCAVELVVVNDALMCAQGGM